MTNPTPLQPELREAFEALMPEAAAFRMRHRSDPGMIGHYPWTYSDPRRRLYDRPACEYEDLYTADQLREAIRGAANRAFNQAYDAMFEVKGDKVTRFDAQTAIRKLQEK